MPTSKQAALIGLLLALLLPVQSWGAARVQVTNSADASVATLAYVSNVTSGNLGCLVTRINFAETPNTNSGVTDTRSSTWALARRVTFGTSFVLELWWTQFPSSGANTVTMAGGAIGRIVLEEASGISASAALDQQTGTTGTGTSAASGNITVSSAEWMCTAHGQAAYPSVAVTAGTGWTRNNANNNKLNAGSPDTAGPFTGTYNGTFTLPESDDWATIVASFKPVSVATTRTGMLLGVGP